VAHIKPMPTRPLIPKRPTGRPPLPPEQRRTGRLSVRVHPAVAAHAKLLTTERIEAAILKIKPIKDTTP
jgi:hypothetical protein